MYFATHLNKYNNMSRCTSKWIKNNVKMTYNLACSDLSSYFSCDIFVSNFLYNDIITISIWVYFQIHVCRTCGSAGSFCHWFIDQHLLKSHDCLEEGIPTTADAAR